MKLPPPTSHHDDQWLYDVEASESPARNDLEAAAQRVLRVLQPNPSAMIPLPDRVKSSIWEDVMSDSNASTVLAPPISARTRRSFGTPPAHQGNPRASGSVPVASSLAMVTLALALILASVVVWPQGMWTTQTAP